MNSWFGGMDTDAAGSGVNPPIESVVSGGDTLAYVIRASFQPKKSTFVTPSHLTQQVGFIVYGAGTDIPRHFHLPLARSIVGTTEVIIVRSGRCTADLYGRERVIAASVELGVGDVIVMVSGGHGFRVHEDTVLLEVKQGPYVSAPEKERF
jgi:hypothetical protein